MSNVRVTYSGLIAFAVGLFSLITGILFTLIVTRRLSPEDFGLWSVIGSLIVYFMISETIVSFWTTRQIARGEDVGKTSLTTSGLFSFGSIPLYIILAFYVGESSNSNFDVMLFATLLIPVNFLSRTLTSINIAHKPQAISYSTLAFEVVKIPAGLGLVYFLDLGLMGAITATLFAFLARIFMQLYFARTKLRNKFNRDQISMWFKLSWVPLYQSLPNYIQLLDVTIVAILAGSTLGVAYYSVALAIAAIVGHAASISQALYPKLVAHGNFNYIQKNFSHLLYFSIPLLGIAIVFSKPALFALNPAYSEISLIVIILSFKTFFQLLTNVFYDVLLGIERVDEEKRPKFRELINSKLFLIPNIKIIHYVTYTIVLSVSISFLILQGFSVIDTIIWWTIISLTFQIPFFLLSVILVRKSVKFSFPTEKILKYVGSTTVFIFVFYLTSDKIIVYHESIFDFLPLLIIQLLICSGIYFILTYLIDCNTRRLLRTIVSEIFKK